MAEHNKRRQLDFGRAIPLALLALWGFLSIIVFPQKILAAQREIQKQTTFAIPLRAIGLNFVEGNQALGKGDSYDAFLGDLDFDGDLDAFITYYDQPNRVYINRGSGAFSDNGQQLGTDKTHGGALGDLDGDGDLDVFLANYQTPDKVYFNNGSAGFTDSGQVIGMEQSHAVDLGDLDGDGDLDAFVSIVGANKVYINNGAGIFADSGQALGSGGSFKAALGDLDQDGDLDAVVANWNNTNYLSKVWLNDGTGVFVDSGQSLGDKNSLDVVLGDLDIDGDLDAFVVSLGEESNKIYLNDGRANLIDSGQRLGVSNSRSVALGDLDEDGDLDAFITNNGEPNQIYLNNGSAIFTDSGLALGSAASFGVSLGDVDGDEDLDAFVANYYGDASAVWINQDPPKIEQIDEQILKEDQTRGPIPIAVTDVDTPVDQLLLLLNSSNPALLPTSNVDLITSGAAHSIYLEPLPDQYGSSVITVTASDGESTTAMTFQVQVAAVNDAPMGLTLENAQVLENQPAGTMVGSFSVEDVDEDERHAFTLIPGQGSEDNTLFAIQDGNLVTAVTLDYEARAEYSIRARVRDQAGATLEQPFTISVTNGNDAPTAHLDFSQTTSGVTVNIPVLHNDVDPENDYLFLAELGEVANGSLGFFSYDTLSYTPNSNFVGTETFTYTVQDLSGAASTALVTILVNPPDQAGVILVNDTALTLEDTPVLIPVLQNDSAPTDMELVFVGETEHGQTKIENDRVLFTPTLDYSGVLTFTYAALGTANGGGRATVSVTVNALNDPPIAKPDNATTLSGEAVLIPVVENDDDVEGDVLTLVSSTQGEYGRTVRMDANTVRYIPNANFIGEDRFAYTIVDGKGAASTGAVFVTVASKKLRPIAVDDVVSVNEDTLAILDLLANDRDPNGDDLQIATVTSPQFGFASLRSDGKVQYIPFANYHGKDSFAYRIKDSTGLSATAGVSVTVQALQDYPSANPVFAQTQVGASLSRIDVFANAANPDNLDLQIETFTQPSVGTVTLSADGSFDYSPPSGYSGLVEFEYTVRSSSSQRAPEQSQTVQQRTSKVTLNVGATSSGSLSSRLATASTGEGMVRTLTPAASVQGDLGNLLLIGMQRRSGVVQDNGDGTLNYMPPPDFTGTDVITYTMIDDRTGAIITGQINVKVIAGNHAPLAATDLVFTNEDTPTSINVLNNDQDRDGDPITVTVALSANYGSVQLGANGVISYTPQTDFSGMDSFAYILQDRPGAVSYGMVAVSVIGLNDPPDTQNDWAYTPEDTRLFVTVLGNDIDIDGEWMEVKAGVPLHGEVIVTPAGSLNYMSDPEFSGTDVFTYTALDEYGAHAQAILTVTVGAVNDNPIAVQDVYTATAGFSTTLDPLANDSDVDSSTLRLITVEGADGTLIIQKNLAIYTPQFVGKQTLSYVVADEDGGQSTGQVIVHVLHPYMYYFPWVQVDN